MLTPESLTAAKISQSKVLLEQAMALQAELDEFTTRMGAHIDSGDASGAAGIACWLPALSQWTNRINEARGALLALDKIEL